MIKAEIHSNGDKIDGFAILGHSGTAPRGQDIYCAGVSSLSQSAYLALVKHLKRQVRFEQASGDFKVILDDEPDELTEAVFQTMLLGLIEIEKLRPDALQVSRVGETVRGEQNDF